MYMTIENPGASPLHVAGIVVLPGETRILPLALLPPHLHPKAAEIPTMAADPLADLLALGVAKVCDALPALDEGLLEQLEAAEAAGAKPRKGVLDAIVKEKLRRASLLKQLEEFNRAVGTMDDRALAAYRENVTGHPEMLAAVDAEIKKRAEG